MQKQKNKRLINGQKILRNLFDDLIEAIFSNNKMMMMKLQ